MLQFAAIWWLPSAAGAARRAVTALQPAARPSWRSDPQTARQLLIDVSIIATHDAGTGIQRVVRSLLLQLLHAPPPGFDIRPVRATRKQTYRYANRYLASLTSVAVEDDDEVRVSSGDIFVGLDLTSRIVPRRQYDLLRWQQIGVRCAFVVYDLLPLLHPDWFTPRARRSFRHWLSTVAIHADSLFCISRAVSDDARYCMTNRFGVTEPTISVGWFHLGANLPVPDRMACAAQPRTLPIAAEAHRKILMVGTIEPRKGHAQVLDAFELLWRAGARQTLIIAGRQGWHVESFVDRLKDHPEAGKRLIWLPKIDDSQLAQLYAEASGLVMASEGEGFGLPIVEAAQYGVPVFVRDLPVFREVADAHATYFFAQTGTELAPQLAAWLERLDNDSAPVSDAMRSLTWSASAERLKALIAELDCQR
ncbi:glycosyltransferase family 4 protein [Paraburkholderia hospita]|uniref:glycosyltransferase family 4 protein n=1 Tax=Paraburkholderia hospita TaxID=169430 RepID=UPI001FC92D86|nr:glycosyltransferase family 1 protein [Paraburkholderia hospita]